jgi:hypothetical protein
MVATDNGVLQEAPDVLKRVRVNVAPDILPLTVLDRFVLSVLIREALVGFSFIGIDGLNIPGDVLTDEAVQGFPSSLISFLSCRRPRQACDD